MIGAHSIRLLVSVPLLFAGSACRAWDTVPHRQITKAALDTLPKAFLDRLGVEYKPLVEIYCIYPDRYEEMARFGFVRKSPGPRDVSEIRRYCVRPDGEAIHGATGDRDVDTGSILYLLERVLTSRSRSRSGEAAQYLGVLSHFVADSLSPPHAVPAEGLLEMTPRPSQGGRIDIHRAIEGSIPEFTLGDRRPRASGDRLLSLATTILDRCYAGGEENRSDLPAIVEAAGARDEQTLNVYRLRAGRTAAEILADAVYSLFEMEEGGR
jgi:hypothetical protein